MPRIGLACGLLFAAALPLQSGCGRAKRHQPGCTAPTCEATGAPLALTGRFAVLAHVFADVSAGGGLVQQSGLEASLLLLADIKQDGLASTLTVKPCDLTLPAVPIRGQQPFVLTVPSALLDSIGAVTAQGSLSQATSCAELIQPMPIALLLGTKMNAPLDDPLPALNTMTGAYPPCGPQLLPCASAPASTMGSCICDQEQDMKVGATLGVTNAPLFTDLDKIYVAVRIEVTLAGNAPSSDLIAGNVITSIEESILGCHRSLQGTADCSLNDVGLAQGVYPLIMQSDASQDSCLASTFTGKRVDPGVECEALRQMRGTLFPP